MPKALWPSSACKSWAGCLSRIQKKGPPAREALLRFFHGAPPHTLQPLLKKGVDPKTVHLRLDESPVFLYNIHEQRRNRAPRCPRANPPTVSRLFTDGSLSFCALFCGAPPHAPQPLLQKGLTGKLGANFMMKKMSRLLQQIGSRVGGGPP